MTTTDLHTLTGAYALHALANDERERFERHAADCEACAQEVRELTAAAARLGLAVTATPGPALKDQVMRRITTVRQEGPRAIPRTAPRG
ncbi:zf-HC2 domain-containing protein, partial [Streptomyces sp. NPDC060027]|uniref:zf-HC2 domain-containing protein n=1 Tax=Streptomyces sp. NPDC060027 TaxID=3347040 RepID=UPI00367F4CE9